MHNPISEAISGRMLHLILFPTEACNCRCVYCYETYRHGRMDTATITGVKNLLHARIPELDHLHVSWFGGEPLLALDIIEELSEHIHQEIADTPGCHFQADVTTNAYLLSLPTFTRLSRCKVGLYQISFDGPQELHDQKRILADGGGTFDRIWSNLLALKETNDDVSFLIRLHLDRVNYPHLYAFLDQYNQAFQDDHRFRLFIRPLSRLGGPHDAILPVFDEQEGQQATRELARYAASHNIPNKTLHDFPTMCYAAKLNSFVVRANGDINKCTVSLDHECNKVGVVRKNGTLRLDKKRLFQWVRGIESGNERELLCPLENMAFS